MAVISISHHETPDHARYLNRSNPVAFWLRKVTISKVVLAFLIVAADDKFSRMLQIIVSLHEIG